MSNALPSTASWRNAASSPPEHGDIEVRTPATAEWAACRMLVPELFIRGRAPEAFVAIHRCTKQIVGAAAFLYANDRVENLRFRVIRSYRRKGVATTLVDRVRESAIKRGYRQLYCGTEISLEPDAQPFLLARGFRQDFRLYEFEGELGPILKYLRRIGTRLVQSGRIPQNARWVGPEDAPHDQIARMCAQYIAGSPNVHLGYVLPTLKDKRVAGSTVLLIDGVVYGLMLCQLNDGHNVLTVDSRIVLPQFRGGWVNCMLMLRSAELAATTGSTRVRFSTRGDNMDTLKLARRCDADVKRVRGWFVRDLE